MFADIVLQRPIIDYYLVGVNNLPIGCGLKKKIRNKTHILPSSLVFFRSWAVICITHIGPYIHTVTYYLRYGGIR